MKNRELTELEQRTLNCIINNTGMMASDLTRRMHGMGITDKNDRQDIIDALESDLKLIESEPAQFKLGKRGRRAKVFSATKLGKEIIKKIMSEG